MWSRIDSTWRVTRSGKRNVADEEGARPAAERRVRLPFHIVVPPKSGSASVVVAARARQHSHGPIVRRAAVDNGNHLHGGGNCFAAAAHRAGALLPRELFRPSTDATALATFGKLFSTANATHASQSLCHGRGVPGASTSACDPQERIRLFVGGHHRVTDPFVAVAAFSCTGAATGRPWTFRGSGSAHPRRSRRS